MIGRDHLDSGSVASPYRETEAMRDGSDAIADWPILNALVNMAAGATWVSVHHGGGVGIGNSIHAGMVVVADGTDEAAERLERVLTTDPGTGVMRHADAGYDEALDAAARARAATPRLDAERADRADGCSSATSRRSLRPRGRDAPLRGAALGEVEVRRGRVRALRRTGAIAAVGRDARPRPARRRRRWSSTAAASARSPGSSTATRIRLRAATASRSSRCAPAARLRGAARRRRRHPLDRPRDARGRRGRRCARAVERHRGWMLRAGTTTFEAKSGYGLDRETELASLRAIRAAGGVPTWLGAHAVPPEFDDADAYLDFALAEVLPEAATLAEAADVFLERGAFDAAQARRYLEACRDAGLALRLHGDQFTEAGAIPLAIELGARSVDHLEATGDGRRRARSPRATSTGVLLPASALFLGRPMPPARALVDAGAAVALATDFNPGSAFCESLPLVCSLAARSSASARPRRSPPARSTPPTCSAAPTARAARARLRRRPRPARRARLALPRLPPRRRPSSAVVEAAPGVAGRRG